jgi:hypothetical protein
MDFSSSPESSADEGSVTMGRSNNSSVRGQPPKHGDLDLSAVLNVEQKLQLQQLITVILDMMQKEVRDVFDAIGQDRDGSEQGISSPKPTWNLIPNPFSNKYAHLYGNKPLSPERSTEGQKDSAKPGTEASSTPNPAPNSGTPLLRLPKSAEEATEMSKKDENEILTATLTELKRDALTYFGKWRGAVLRRVGDITIKNGGNGGNVVGQAPQQPAGNSRRPGSAGRGRPSRPSGGKFFLHGNCGKRLRNFIPLPSFSLRP